jgi:S-adenosyl methyltransferase
VIDGDLCDPAGILAHPDVRRHLDWEQPIGLLMCGILHYVLDDERPAEVVATLYNALPPGSYVFIHHLLASEDPAAAILQEQMRAGLGRAQFRTPGPGTGPVRRTRARRARPGDRPGLAARTPDHP